MTVVVTGDSDVRMFCAAGSSVGVRILCVDVNAPFVIVPFQTPIARIAEPLTSVEPATCVSIEKLQLPARKPVPPARSWMKPVPLGVVLALLAEVVLPRPGLKRK